MNGTNSKIYQKQQSCRSVDSTLQMLAVSFLLIQMDSCALNMFGEGATSEVVMRSVERNGTDTLLGLLLPSRERRDVTM